MNSLVKNTDDGISEIREDIIKPVNLNMEELQLILTDIRSKLKNIDDMVKAVGQSDKDIIYFKEEMRVWLDEVTDLSSRINTMIGDKPQENIELP